MTKNEGNMDRIIRIVLGLALIAYALLKPDAPLAIFAWVGVIPLATGAMGWCPLYTLFGIKTCKTKTPE